MSGTRSFHLVEASRLTGVSEKNKSARRFLDFCVDDLALYPVVVAAGYGNVSPLWTGLSAATELESNRAIDRLLGQAAPDAPMGRVSVYVCPERGDLGCGAITVRLGLSVTSVTWSAWGYQRDYEDEVHPLESEVLVDMTFDRAQYESALVAAWPLLRIRP
jgi:hypothetical protein